MITTFSLQSGSNGNAIWVEAGGVRLLFDAGISGRQAELRANQHGQSLHDIDALIISHDHTDHTRCAGVYHRRFQFPIFATEATSQAVGAAWGKVFALRKFLAGQTICFNGVQVHTVPTPHDGVDGVAFVVEHDGLRLGILTDLGHPFAGLARLMDTLDAAYLESNYDPRMLAEGPYPDHLKARIAGDAGHLSNGEGTDLVRPCLGGRLRWLALAHLSEHNNDPDLALRTHRQAYGPRLPVHLASRYGVSEMFGL